MSKATVSDIVSLVEEAGIETASDGLDPAVSLFDQGLDSLDMMNVYFQIEEKYGITVAEDSIGNGEWDSLEKIVESVNKYLP